MLRRDVSFPLNFQNYLLTTKCEVSRLHAAELRKASLWPPNTHRSTISLPPLPPCLSASESSLLFLLITLLVTHGVLHSLENIQDPETRSFIVEYSFREPRLPRVNKTVSDTMVF